MNCKWYHCILRAKFIVNMFQKLLINWTIWNKFIVFKGIWLIYVWTIHVWCCHLVVERKIFVILCALVLLFFLTVSSMTLFNMHMIRLSVAKHIHFTNISKFQGHCFLILSHGILKGALYIFSYTHNNREISHRFPPIHSNRGIMGWWWVFLDDTTSPKKHHLAR